MKTVDINKELYVPLLAAVHLYPDEAGILSRKHRNAEKVCEVNKRKLALPTSENLKSLSPDEYIFFHPMSENIARGDSAVYNYLRIAMTLRINFTIMSVARLLMEVAGSKDLDGKLNSRQLDLVAAIPKIDAKTIKHFDNAIVDTDLDKNTFFTVYNKRNGKIGETTYNRVAVVRFPLIEQLKNPEESEFWKKAKGIRKADYVNYLQLFNYLLPDWDVENKYSGASDSMEAPSFQALVYGFLNVMKRLDQVMEDFKDVCDVTDFRVNDIDVIERNVNNLVRYVNLIAPLDGNTGDMAANENQVNKLNAKPMGVPPANLLNAAENKFNNVTTAASAAQQQAVQQPMNQPQAQAQPQEQRNSAFIGFGPGTIQHQQMMNQQAMMNNPWNTQQQQNNGFITNPAFQNQGGWGQQTQQVTQANDPLAAWNQQVGSMNTQQGTNPWANQQNTGWGGQQAWGGNAWGQPQVAAQANPWANQQGFGGGQQWGQQQQNPWGQPQRPVFRKAGEQPSSQPSLPPTFGTQNQQQAQPTFGQTTPKFRTI